MSPTSSNISLPDNSLFSTTAGSERRNAYPDTVGGQPNRNEYPHADANLKEWGLYPFEVVYERLMAAKDGRSFEELLSEFLKGCKNRVTLLNFNSDSPWKLGQSLGVYARVFTGTLWSRSGAGVEALQRYIEPLLAESEIPRRYEAWLSGTWMGSKKEPRLRKKTE